MPIHKVKGGWKWGSHGKVYPSRKGAERQAAAAYANGYRETLEGLLERLRGLLEGVSVQTDTKDIVKLVDVTLADLVARGSNPNSQVQYTQKDASHDRPFYVRELEKSAAQIAQVMKAAVGRIPNWTGSEVVVKLLPLNSGFGDTFMSDSGKMTDFAEVLVFKRSPHNAPSFTYFGGTEVDDVLDAGDSDFFHDPEVEQDYFALVNELRHPGEVKRDGGKVLRLYTARPVKDRSTYQKARSIPSNIFLTTSEDEAEGYAKDFGSRDIWQVHIKKKYLVQTLDTPRVKNYQTFGSSGKVPVEALTLIAPAD